MIVIDLSRANGKGRKKKTWVSTCSKPPRHTDRFGENCLNKFITLTFEIAKHVSDSFDQRLGIHYRTQSNPAQITRPSYTWLVKHRLRGLFAQNVIHSGFQIGIDGPCLMASGLSKWHATKVISLVAIQWHGLNESVKNCSWSSCPWQFDQLIRFTWDKTWQNHAYQGLSNTWLTSKKENWQPSTKNHHWLLYLLQAHLGQGIAWLQLWVCHLHTKQSGTIYNHTAIESGLVLNYTPPTPTPPALEGHPSIQGSIDPPHPAPVPPDSEKRVRCAVPPQTFAPPGCAVPSRRRWCSSRSCRTFKGEALSRVKGGWL